MIPPKGVPYQYITKRWRRNDLVYYGVKGKYVVYCSGEQSAVRNIGEKDIFILRIKERKEEYYGKQKMVL